MNFNPPFSGPNQIDDFNDAIEECIAQAGGDVELAKSMFYDEYGYDYEELAFAYKCTSRVFP